MAQTTLDLLGFPVFRLEGAPVGLPTHKLWGLLGYLALEGPQTREHLATLLWDLPEERARANLRRELFRLPQRSFLEQKGERLGLVGVKSDIEELLQAVAARDWARAQGFFRGEFMQGLRVRAAPLFEEWLESTRLRLQALQAEVLYRWAVELLEQGHLEEALERAERLLALDALHEEGQVLRLRLLAGLGRQVEALKAYEAYRQRLWRELGVEPSESLVALAGALRWGKAVTLPSSTRLKNPPLMGREEAWGALQTAGGLALLVAEGGLGKTRLLQEYAQLQPGFRWVAHRKSPLEAGFGGLVEVLRALWEKGELSAGVWREELARLLPELRVPARPLGEGEAGLALSRLHEALVQTLAAGLPAGGVVVLDDLHHADAATLAFLPYLVRRSRAFGVRVLGATRPEALREPHPLAAALRELERDGLLSPVRLHPLAEEDVLRLVRTLSRMETGGVLFSRRLHRATGGNPLFLLRTLEHLMAQGLLRADPEGWHTPFDEATEDYRELPLPESIHEEVVRGLEALGGRRAAEMLAVAGNPLDPFSLRRLLGGETLAWMETLEGLEAAGYLRGGAEGYTFAHELFRQAVLEEMPPARRRTLHVLLAEELLAQGEAPYRHLEAAGRLKEAWHVAMRAGRTALERQAFPVAAEILSWAREVQKRAGAEAEDQARLLLELEEALMLSGQIPAQEAVLKTLESLTPELPSSLRLETGLRRVRFLAMGGRWGEALAHAEAALALGEHPQICLFRADALANLGKPGAREEALRVWEKASQEGKEAAMAAAAYLLAKLAVVAESEDLETWLGHLARLGRPGLAEVRLKQFACTLALRKEAWAEALAEATEAYTRAEALGYREALGVFQNFRGLALVRLERYAEALESYYAAHAHFGELGRTHFQAGVGINLAGLLLRFGAFQEAETWAQRALEVFQAIGEPRGSSEAARALGNTLLWRGNLEGAEALFRQSLGLAEAAGLKQSALEAQADLAVARLLQGNLEEAESLLRQVLEAQRPDWPLDAAWLALALLRQGRAQEARALAEKTLGDRLPTSDIPLLAQAACGLDPTGALTRLRAHRARQQSLTPPAYQETLAAWHRLLDSLFLTPAA
ncbi:hypothetical protein DV704_11480 [Meiothermus sp. QL-1]|uniref:ATP-binding protein n=1 Tax=Meiothermus sp. QL-1 TaxID=2058095 RepID=UPI000E0C0D8C|nr:BTAD domain-containing putative transcriptional regulator [Meiothermus sp. QL-1]RDI94604.1 hypothetical protein DV704_11480 [Meiothermus sp. QL-1]